MQNGLKLLKKDIQRKESFSKILEKKTKIFTSFSTYSTNKKTFSSTRLTITLKKDPDISSLKPHEKTSLEQNHSLILQILKSLFKIDERKQIFPENMQNFEFLKEIEIKSPEFNRQLLYEWLTVLTVPIPEEINKNIDILFRRERAERDKSISYSSIPLLHSSHPISIWRGDITRLEVDAIVNAANRNLLGCNLPNHKCIDNIIHTRAGPRLRMDCKNIMKRIEGRYEDTGKAKITKGHHLYAKHVIHTVGPIISPPRRQPTTKEEILLSNCYREILEISRFCSIQSKLEKSKEEEEICKDYVKKNEFFAPSGMKIEPIKSLAFCCISTGEFGYRQELAAENALKTVKSWLDEGENKSYFDRIIFNVFTPKDEELYLSIAPKIFN